MMKVVAITILVLMAVSASARQDDHAGEELNVISVQHDAHRQVTCWVLNGVGISCLPDSSLPQQATPSSEAGRASPTSAEPGSLPLQAAPLPQNERLQL